MITETISAIVVGGLSSTAIVLAATLPVLISTRRKAAAAASDAAGARNQVENSHTKNFRDDHDDKHAEVLAAVDRVDRRVGNVESDLRGVRRDVGRLADAHARHDERIHDLEQTQPRAQVRKKGSS